MSRPTYTLLAAAAFLVLIGVLTIGAPRAATGQKGGPPVVNAQVVNSQSNPVPVTLQGSAQIDTSSPIPVRDVNNPAQTRVQIAVSRVFGDHEQNSPYSVPAGKRLVIEYVSGLGSIQGGNAQVNGAKVVTTVDGESHAHIFPMNQPVAGDPAKQCLFGQVTRLYADPETQVSIIPNFRGTADQIDVVANMSGYLVDSN